MINIITIIPYVGNSLTKFMRRSSYVTITRILIIHYAFGFLLGSVIIVHLVLLHNFSSSSPFINNYSSLLLPFIILFFKDGFSYIVVCSMYSMFLSLEPDILGNEHNQTLANALVTPPNIIPERYFPLLHSVPRAIPIKLIGAILIIPSFVLVVVVIYYVNFLSIYLNSCIICIPFLFFHWLFNYCFLFMHL